MTSRLAILEALADERIGVLPTPQVGDELDTLCNGNLVEQDNGTVRLRRDVQTDVRRQVTTQVREQLASCSGHHTSQGQLLEEFERYCRDELDEVDVLTAGPTRCVVTWRQEQAAIELRAGHLGCEQLAGKQPVLLLTPVDTDLVHAFLNDATLRQWVAAYDLALQYKTNVVRCPVFVYFEWFLRERYGVKILPSPEFTTGLIEQGVISTGMG